MECPRCGAEMEGGICPECGFPEIQKRPGPYKRIVLSTRSKG